jgi:hypothetical protein
MLIEPSDEIEPAIRRLWQLLDLALTMATAADAEDHLDQIAALCESAAKTARAAAALRHN